MFDIANNISGENAYHMDFIRNKAKPVFESWGYKVVILRADTDYLCNFYSVINNPRKHQEHKGMRRGFVPNGLCSIKRDCKLKPLDRYFHSLTEKYIQYVGICANEEKRLRSLSRDCSKRSLLAQYGYTEEMAKRKCMEYDLLSPVYDLTRRGGCWFCPNAKLAEHRELRERDINTWKRFIALEKESNLANNKWNVFSDTLEDRERILSGNLHNTIM